MGHSWCENSTVWRGGDEADVSEAVAIPLEAFVLELGPLVPAASESGG